MTFHSKENGRNHFNYRIMNLDYPTKPKVQSTVKPKQKPTYTELFRHIYNQLKKVK